MKKAIFPGSFDPFTIGHKDILDQALNVFDEIIIAVGENSSKSCMFSLKDRIRFIEKSIETNSKITVESYSDLTTSFCEFKDVSFLIRGLRNTNDFVFEKDIKDIQDTFSNVKSVYFISGQNFSYVNSSLVRDIIKNGGKYNHLLPFKLKN
ncbi:MAG: pantetheine-phosphate adenylyltransferase [Flavobacteriaceae bacterium]|tara:strand:- start:11945 stop:12397 length:453 start_codon:yes stop_codon:yes gene_type:complete